MKNTMLIAFIIVMGAVITNKVTKEDNIISVLLGL